MIYESCFKLFYGNIKDITFKSLCFIVKCFGTKSLCGLSGKKLLNELIHRIDVLAENPITKSYLLKRLFVIGFFIFLLC